MSKLNDISNTAVLANSVVVVADSRINQIANIVKRDRQLVRANLIAYCAFCISWAASEILDERDVAAFSDRIVKVVTDKCGGSTKDRFGKMLRNRQEGFLVAVMNLEHDSLALANYFQACCSVDRIEIDYADIFPDPKSLEDLDKSVGLTDAGRKMIKKIRSMNEPAIYPMEGLSSNELFNILASVMEEIKLLLARFA